MKIKKRISWLMGIVQKSLLPHLDECLNIPLTEREEKLVSILEIAEIEKYVYRTASNQWLGRKVMARKAIARALVAKAYNRYATTADLIRRNLTYTTNLP